MHGGGAGERDECAGDGAHEADGAAAVDEVPGVGVEGRGEGACGVEVFGVVAGGGAAAVEGGG